MHENYRKQFADLLNSTFLVINPNSQPISSVILKAWWDDLIEYPYEVIEKAILLYRKTDTDRLPTPGKIISIIVEHDGRPTADEAWGIVKPIMGNEQLSAILTEDMTDAWGLAAGVWPDSVGARRTFIDAYTRAVENARKSGFGVKWWFVQGHNKDLCAEMAKKGLEDGRLSADQARVILPTPTQDGLQAVDLIRENIDRKDLGLTALPSTKPLSDSRQRMYDKFEDLKRELERNNEAHKREKEVYVDVMRPIRLSEAVLSPKTQEEIKAQFKNPQPIGTLSIGMDGKPERWIKEDSFNKTSAEVFSFNDIREN